jgi:oligopeptide/dipeptide ABC transporter ATP-binding protein
LRTFRSKKVGMIFQDPFSSLNPVVRVGAQIGETLRLNVGCDRSEAKLKAIELLDSVGIPRPRERYRAYPHELSGGMRQRVMIALATASGPRLLLADEPTTALDVTTQKQILELLSQMRQDLGMAMLIVSHDFGVIAQMCDRVTVMYGGYVVESGPIEAIYDTPQHPYTRALLDSIPDIEVRESGVRRKVLAGQPPELGDISVGCPFASRCQYVRAECRMVTMDLEEVGADHYSACPFRPLSIVVRPLKSEAKNQ